MNQRQPQRFTSDRHANIIIPSHGVGGQLPQNLLPHRPSSDVVQESAEPRDCGTWFSTKNPAIDKFNLLSENRRKSTKLINPVLPLV